MLWEVGKAPAINIYSFLQLSRTEGPNQRAERGNHWILGCRSESRVLLTAIPLPAFIATLEETQA